MASTYSSLKIELIGTGDQTGTWGETTNNNLQYALEEAITGSTDITFSNTDVTLTFINSNLPQQARNLRLNLIGTASTPLNLVVPAIEKLYLINNTLASAITIKNATGTGATVLSGKSAWIFNDGTNVSDAINSFGSTIAVTSGGTGTTTSTGTGSVVLNTSPTLITPALGTPSSGVLTNCTGLPLTGAAGITGTLPVFNGGTGVTTSTGSGSVVLSNSPALTTPNLGTPSAGNFSTGTFTWPTFNQNTTGNAATATALTSILGVAGGGTGVTTSTGTGSTVLNTNPTLITPTISSPSITTPTITTPIINSATLNPTGSQPLFVPRSWIRFNSNVRADINYTYTQTGFTVTVTTASAHNLVTGNAAYLNMNSGTAVTGMYQVTVINSTTFTTTQAASRTTSGIGVMQCVTFTSGGNVSTNIGYLAAGQFIMNFLIPTPTTDYILLGTAGNNGDRTVGPHYINVINDGFTTGYVLLDIRDTAGNRQNEDYNGVSILY